MITKVITIGCDQRCDFEISEHAMPLVDSCYFDRIIPVHAQIIQEDEKLCYLIPFSDYISVNNQSITELHHTKENLMGNNVIRLGEDDQITIGIFNIFWQQWMVGLGLRCNECKYYSLRCSNDEWCEYCKQSHHNPSPYIYGYSSKFSIDKGYFNYTDCNKCALKPNWCIECNFRVEQEPKNRSFKEHVDMYLQRLKAIPAKP